MRVKLIYPTQICNFAHYLLTKGIEYTPSSSNNNTFREATYTLIYDFTQHNFADGLLLAYVLMCI